MLQVNILALIFFKKTPQKSQESINFGAFYINVNQRYRNFILQSVLFSDYTDIRFKIFLETELGQLYQAIPFKELALPYRKYKNLNPQGLKPIFSIEGGIGLQFLKHYLQLSDAKLIARINSDWQLQMFCGISLRDTHPIRDVDIVGRWRLFLGKHGDIENLQRILVNEWKPNMSQTHVRMDDATVFESYIKYPTDEKLLWDCVEWVWKEIKGICARLKLAKPRFRYDWHQKKQMTFSKMKRKTRSKSRKRCRESIKALGLILGQLQGLLNKGKEVVSELEASFFERLKTVRIILGQQMYHYHHPTKPIPHRIVSLYKPYIRPIVRGKENKRVEFGAKVHISQVDGINLIEHLDFEAFHEGKRVWFSVYKHQKDFGTLKQYSGDQIYANNKNRKYLKKREVSTSFRKKGNDSKATAEQASQMRSILAKARATRLEGSFGNEKNHYMLQKVKARTQATEVIWIFFGIHTANALVIGRRIAPIKSKKSRGQPPDIAKVA